MTRLEIRFPVGRQMNATGYVLSNKRLTTIEYVARLFELGE